MRMRAKNVVFFQVGSLRPFDIATNHKDGTENRRRQTTFNHAGLQRRSAGETHPGKSVKDSKTLRRPWRQMNQANEGN